MALLNSVLSNIKGNVWPQGKEVNKNQSYAAKAGTGEMVNV